MKHKYLLVVRASLHFPGGKYISSWHEMTGDDAEDKANLFGMTISSKMNMGSGVLVLNSDEKLSIQEVEKYIQGLSDDEYKKFVEEAKP